MKNIQYILGIASMVIINILVEIVFVINPNHDTSLLFSIPVIIGLIAIMIVTCKS